MELHANRLLEAKKHCEGLEKDVAALLAPAAASPPDGREDVQSNLRDFQEQFLHMAKALALAIQNSEVAGASRTRSFRTERTRLNGIVTSLEADKRELEKELYDLEEVVRLLREDVDRRWQHEVQLETHARVLEAERKETLEELSGLQRELAEMRVFSVEVTSAVALSDRRVAELERLVRCARDGAERETLAHERALAEKAGELAATALRLDEAQRTCAEQRDSLASLAEDRERLRRDLDSARTEFAERSDAARRELARQVEETEKLQHKAEDLSESVRAFEREREIWSSQLKSLEERRSREKQQAQHTLQEVMDKLESAQADIAERAAAVEERDADLSRIKADLTKSTNQLKHTEASLAKRTEQYDRSLEEVAALRKEIQEAAARQRGELEDRENSAWALRVDLEKAMADAANAVQSLGKRSEQLEEAKRHMAELRAQVATEQQASTAKQRALDEKAATTSALRGDLERTQADLAIARRDRLHWEAEAGRAHDAAREARVSFEERVCALEDRLAQANEELLQRELQGTQLSKTVADRDARMSTIQADLAEIESELAQTNRLLEKKTSEAESTDARLRNALAELQDVQERTERQVQQLQADLSKRAAEATNLSEKLMQKEASLADLRERLQKASVSTLHPSVTVPSQKSPVSQKLRAASLRSPGDSVAHARAASEFAKPDEETPSKRRKLLGPSSSSSRPRMSSKSSSTSSVCGPIGPVPKSSTAQPSRSSPSRPRKRKVVIAFSGFRDTDPVYTTAFKNTLRDIATELGAVIRETDQEFDQKITHIVSPVLPRPKTLKVYAASVSSKYIMRPDWITASKAAGCFVPEADYGVRYLESPFRDKTFYLTPAFTAENVGPKAVRTENSRTLIESLGGGSITDDFDASVDFVLTSERDTRVFPNVEKLTWRTFLLKIPVPT